MFSLSLCLYLPFDIISHKSTTYASALFPFEIYLLFVFTYFAREKFPRKFLKYLQSEWHRTPFAFFRPPPLALPQDTIKFRFFSLLFSFPPSPSEFFPFFAHVGDGEEEEEEKKVGSKNSRDRGIFLLLFLLFLRLGRCMWGRRRLLIPAG